MIVKAKKKFENTQFNDVHPIVSVTAAHGFHDFMSTSGKGIKHRVFELKNVSSEII